MNLPILAKGLVVGVSIAAPVGPIGILCIRRSLREGMAAGLATGLGAATADAAYGAVAGLGLASVSGFISAHHAGISLLGGVFLCYLGVRTFLSPLAAEAAAEVGARNLVGAWGSTLLLTLGNPATILSFAAVFAAFGLGASSGLGSAVSLVLGVFLGSAAWWLALSTGVSRLRSRVTPGGMRIINRLSGIVLLGFGAAAVMAR